MSEPNRDRFVEWLKTFPSDAIVGTSCDDCDCPLARYLTTLHPKGVSVSSQGCWWIRSHMSAYYELPLWAQRFIEAVDIPNEHETKKSLPMLPFLSSRGSNQCNRSPTTTK